MKRVRSFSKEWFRNEEPFRNVEPHQNVEPFQNNEPFQPASSPPFPDLRGFLRQAFSEMEALLDPSRLDALLRQTASQVNVSKRDGDYVIRVEMRGIEKPEDIHAEPVPGGVRLSRSSRRETRLEKDAGVMYSSQFESFERFVPLPSSVRWARRSISCRPGVWTLTLPGKSE